MNVARYIGLLALLCLLCISCAHTSGTRDIEPGKRPSDTSVEGGLWMHVESLEHKLATSGRVVKDPALNAYVREIICQLTPEHCDYIRFYIVRTPHFNASMSPNGFMEIWTGLLLRAENEAQLSYILGHEIAHYLRRHTLQQWQAVKSTLNAIMVMDLAAGTATVAGVPGVGIAGDTVSIVAIAGLFAYSREHEREADRMGQGLKEAGFVIGAVLKGKLCLIIYTAARAHYYDKYKQQVERLVASIQVNSLLSPATREAVTEWSRAKRLRA